jgi:hypothetical protein
VPVADPPKGRDLGAAPKRRVAKPPVEIKPVEPPEATVIPQVVVGPGDLVPADLVAYFTTHSTLEANKLVEVFLGQRIKRLTGVVDDVIGSAGRPAITMYFDERYDYVMAYFDKEWDARVSARRKGSTVTLSGTIREVGSSYVVLEDCELVEPLGDTKKPAAPRS